MSRAPEVASTSDRFVEATLDLIAELGGSGSVNLRQISRRVGCAHTNVYNYFASYSDLLWETFRSTLAVYGEWLTRELDRSLSREDYFTRLLTNFATFPQAQPGLYRFIASDRMPTDDIPEDILAAVGGMKEWLAATVASISDVRLTAEQATIVADVVLAYLDGETLNLINDRVVPGEEIAARIVDNALRIHRLLVEDVAANGGSSASKPAAAPYPTLDVPALLKGH